MQKFIMLLFMFIGTLSLVDAQTINEENKSMSLGKQVGFQIDIDGADEDITEDVWKDFIKDFGKSKRNKKAREYYSVGARVPLINGANDVDIYIRFDERVNMTSVMMWVDLGESFVNSNEYPKEAQGAEEFLMNFYLAVKKKSIEKEMKEQEKVMNKMEKELRKLEKKNTGYHKDIEKAKEKIEKAEKNIEQNLKDQEDQRITIEQQRKVIEEIIERLNNLGRN
ncbi:MAG: hypothetical protein P1U56_06410 [Saprospiraceae bacterium]|nr:hypothetical protein [Saprospiraceae bacterium]